MQTHAIRGKLASGSAWDRGRIGTFLAGYEAPLRIAVNTRDGFPLVCSLWFEFADGRLLCATQRGAAVSKRLMRDPRCGFEVAPNQPPYLGVRGRGRATLSSTGAADLLGRLIDRYLGGRESELAQWLLARTSDEVVIAIEPEWTSSWDYSERMGS